MRIATHEWAELVSEIEARAVAHNEEIALIETSAGDTMTECRVWVEERSQQLGSCLYLFDGVGLATWGIIRTHTGLVLPIAVDPAGAIGPITAAPVKWDRWEGRPIQDIADIICII
jgi:hypothetical protein